MIQIIRDLFIITFLLSIGIYILIEFISTKRRSRKRKQEEAIKEAAKKLIPNRRLEFEFYNPHPNGVNTIDCTTRSYTKAFNLTYEEAFNLQIEYALGSWQMPTSDWINAKIRADHGWVRKEFPEDGLKINEITVPGPAILENDGHVVYTDGIKYYDLAPGTETVYHHYWIKEDNNGEEERSS